MPEWPEFHLGALLRRLSDADVKFIVIGGIAAVAHGSPRFTRDLDVVYDTNETNLDRLGDALAALGATLRSVTGDIPFVPVARKLPQARLLEVDTDEGRLDLVVEPDGSRGYEGLLAGSIEAVVHGVAIRIAGLDDLIAMKKAAGRPWDRVHVEELEVIRRLSREADSGG